MGFDVRKPVVGFTNIKGTDQPAHLHSLISAYVLSIMESIISELATSKINNEHPQIV